MPFSERAKTIALAIVKIFETSKPFGDYSAVAVLDDGAGISYGTSQFTHKSGSLNAVLERYLKLGGVLPDVISAALPDFASGKNILKRSNDKALRTALARAGSEALMQQAQREIAFENYLKPALEACEGSDFTCPLSLAVIYDSMNHGSYSKIRDKVQLNLPASIKPIEYEKEWITEYVNERHAWLNSVARLKKTAYRTKFFLDQIKSANWNLTLPLKVHGFNLTEQILFPTGTKDSAAVSTSAPSAVGPQSSALPSASLQPPTSAESSFEITPQGISASSTTGPSQNVAIEKKEGWLKRKWKELLAYFTGLGGLDGLTEYFGKLQTFGLSPEYWKRISYLALAGVVIYLVQDWYRDYQERKLTAKLVDANSTATNMVAVVPTSELESYEKSKNWEVVKHA